MNKTYFFNTKTKKKELLRPINPPNLTMYVCGMTVYDNCHMGHARILVVFDTINRLLRNNGFKLTYVRNITDIDDKIINKAKELNISTSQLTVNYIKEMDKDCDALNILAPDIQPKATLYIDKIINCISKLLDKSYAYITEGGDVMYRINAFENYGKLANKELAELLPGKRLKINELKKKSFRFCSMET